MAGFTVAGFGFNISMADLKWIMLLLFISVTIAEVMMHSDLGFITIIDRRVMGYPKCDATFCFAPSAGDLNNAAMGFYGLSQPVDLANFVILLTTTMVSSLWVLFKLVVSVSIIWVPVQALMRWYNFWMPGLGSQG